MTPQLRQQLLEHRATLARQRLLAVVDELDRKRHALSHPVKLLQKQLPDPAWLVLGAAAAFAGFAAVASVVLKVRAKRRRMLFRVAPARPRFSEDVATRTAKALVTFGLVQLGKYFIERGSKRLLEAQTQRSPGNLAASGASFLRGVGDLNP